MLDLVSDESLPRLNFGITVAGINIAVEAPSPVLAVLASMLAFVPRFDDDVRPDTYVSAKRMGDVWEIRGAERALKILAGGSALPQVAGAIVSSAMHAVTVLRDVKALRATVLEKDRRALVMLGDDWESALTLAAHLHGRGWQYVGADCALLDCATLEVHPVQKALYVNSSALRQFPARYRPALETSPWYTTPAGISFYAVDPRKAGLGQAWAPVTKLTAAVVVDGAIAERPSLESFDGDAPAGERFARLGIDWNHVGAVDLRLGSCVATCDLIDHWFESIAS